MICRAIAFDAKQISSRRARIDDGQIDRKSGCTPPADGLPHPRSRRNAADRGFEFRIVVFARYGLILQPAVLGGVEIILQSRHAAVNRVLARLMSSWRDRAKHDAAPPSRGSPAH